MAECSAMRSRSGGFSLLEMLVAVAILGLALGSLYQAASGATRNVRSAERYAFAVELARSLVANNAVVPESGLDTSGETGGGYSWQVTTRSREGGRGNRLEAQLQDMEVSVSWFDGSKQRRVVLHSVVEELRR